MDPVVYNIPKYESNLYSSDYSQSSSLLDPIKYDESIGQKLKNKDSITTLLSSFE